MLNQKRQNILFCIIFILIFACCSKKQRDDEKVLSDPAAEKVVLPPRGYTLEEQLSDSSITYFIRCSVGDISFKLTSEGVLQWGDGYKENFKLAVTDYIEDAFFYLKDQNTLYLFYVESDMDYAGSKVEMIDLKEKKSIWTAQIYGFNLGQPYVKADFVYVTSIGFVGKLNLQTGVYEYKYTDLYDYDKASFNSFDTIVFKGNETHFVSKNYKSGRMDDVIVNEISKQVQVSK